MKIATENLHLILTEELYKVNEINKTTTTYQTPPPKPSKSDKTLLKSEEESPKAPGLQIITESLTDASRSTLGKLLKAINQNIETTSVIESWQDTIHFEKTLIFGYHDQETKLNTLQEKKTHQVLHTYNISYLNNHKESKIKFWKILKAWFNT